MVKMLMACVSGISSHQFAEHLNEAAQKKGLDVTCESCAIDTIAEKVGSFHVLLVGPMASNAIKDLEKTVNNTAPIVQLGLADFNILNIDTILNKGLAAVK